MSTTRLVRRYLHDNSDELSDLWDYEASQQDVYHYALYEVSVDLEVEMETGRSRIMAVNGIPLTDPGPLLPKDV